MPDEVPHPPRTQRRKGVPFEMGLRFKVETPDTESPLRLRGYDDPATSTRALEGLSFPPTGKGGRGLPSNENTEPPSVPAERRERTQFPIVLERKFLVPGRGKEKKNLKNNSEQWITRLTGR